MAERGCLPPLRGITDVEPVFSTIQWLLLIPVAGGSLYGLLSFLAFWRFRTRADSFPVYPDGCWPPVTILKPVCGLEKHLKANLRSACLQDYPDYQVVFSVQRSDDPALALLWELQAEYPDRVSVATESLHVCPNPKIANLMGAMLHARHEMLVISDSDVCLGPDYLRRIIAPLADPEVGLVCTLYRATAADRWFEKMELLTLNADFIPSVVFAYMTGASKCCLGSSMAVRRTALMRLGGLAAFGSYLAEDYEMGRRLWENGTRMVLVPYWVDLVVELKDLSHWWNHQVLWDQKTRAARPAGFFATIVTRSIPFAILFAAFHPVHALGWAVMGGALFLRLSCAGLTMGVGLGDRQGVKSLALLPLRDVAGLFFWALALVRREIGWRGSRLLLTAGGRVTRQVLQ